MSESNSPLVVHIIFSLGTGGLENGLVNIINHSPPGRYRHAIVCLTESREFSRRIDDENVEIHELHKTEGHDWSMYLRLLRLLRKLRPNIIHTRNLAALDVNALGIFFRSVRQVHGEHGRDIYDVDGNNRKYLILRKFMRLFVDRYIAVSKDLEQWLLESVRVRESRLSQIYNGVDQVKFKPAGNIKPIAIPGWTSTDKQPVVIGTVGRLVEIKDQSLILKAVAELIDQDPGLRKELRLVLVGNGPLEGQLRKEVEALSLDGLVWMTGERDDIPELLQTMDIFVLPSLGEGISNTVLEAMATELPVVATDVGGNRELIEHGVNGLLFPVGDSEALSEALAELLKSPYRRQEMGRRALNKVRDRFQWDRTVSEYFAVYDELLSSR